MINVSRLSRVLYVLLICVLYLVVINAEEESVQTDVKNTNVNDQHWFLDINRILEKFHSSSAAKVIDSISFRAESDDNNDESAGPTTAQKYGYGFLSIFLISTFSLAGAVVFPLTKKPYYKYINAFFISLAVGALFSNSVFELLPAIVLHESKSKHKSANSTHHNETKPDEDDEPKVPLYLWQMLILVITAYLFYVIEMMINVFINYRNRVNKDTYSLHREEGPSEELDRIPRKSSIARDRSDTILSGTFPHLQLVPDEKKPHATGWMIIIGDGIHNVADGLAIGAAFANSILFGVTTSIAIAFQELPSELGEYMILIESGFTFRRALLFNFISACTAFAGFFVGVSLSENEGARTWIFSITAGTFIYIALVDLWPTLMTESPVFDWTRFTCVTVGYMVGIFVMFGLAVIT